MNRIQALNYLTAEFDALAADAELTEFVIDAVYGQVIDNALRRLGTAESDLAAADVAGADTPAYLALLDYFALRRFLRILAVRVDIEAGGPTTNLKRSQVFKQVQALLALAQAEIEALGYGTATADEMQMFRINLDFLEPEDAA